MNLPDIKSVLFRTVLFANKPNKLKAVRSVTRRIQTDVQMPARSQQVWQGGGAPRTGVWSLRAVLCTSEDTQGSPGLMSLLRDYRDSAPHPVKRQQRGPGAGTPETLSVLTSERRCCILVLAACFLIAFLSVEFPWTSFPLASPLSLLTNPID